MFRYPSRAQCNELLTTLKPSDNNFKKESDALGTLVKRITTEINSRSEIRDYLTDTKNKLDQKYKDSVATVKLTLPANRVLNSKYECVNTKKIDLTTTEYEFKLTSIPPEDITSTTTHDVVKIVSSKNNVTYELTCTYDKTKTNILTINSIKRN